MYINKDIDYLTYLKDKEIYIFGAGKRGRNVCKRLVSKGYRVVSYIDSYKAGEMIDDFKVISPDKLIEENRVPKIVIVCGPEREISECLLNRNIYNFICESRIDFGGGEEFYDEAYFEWQKPVGEFGAKVKARLFQKYIELDMTILEFGCGGGFLLKELQAKEKLGIDINDSARAFAETIGINSVKMIEEVDDDYADVIISNSVLEHCENPLQVLRELRRKLKPSGKIVFYVPNESCDTEYVKSEWNNHLYTWNCLNLGNLFKAAGYFVCSVEKVQEVWPPNYETIKNEISADLFDAISVIGGKASDENRCLIVACR